MSGAAIPRVRRVEEIIRHLTNDILKGPLSPGERLCEEDLAERFGTSRGPVREALRKLEVRGLICSTPNVGVRVSFYTISDYINLFHARECMEGMAARLAASLMTTKEKTNLLQIIRMHEEQFRTQPEGTCIQPRADIDFHLAIIRGSKNPMIFNILCGDLYPLFQLCRRLHRHIPERGCRVIIEHTRILNALEDRDEEMSEMMMRRHIASTRNYAESILPTEDDKFTDSLLLNARPSLLKWEKIEDTAVYIM